MKKIIPFIIIFIFHQSLMLFSQVKEPDRPDIPELNNSIVSGFKFKVKITVQGKVSSIEEEINLNSDVLITQDNRAIKIIDISRINITLWEKRSKLNRHTYYPSQYELFFRDYRKIVINGNIELLNRIKFSNNKSRYIYTYYYDYFKNGKWVNGGASDFNAFSSKPADGCAVSIELVQ